MKTYKLHLDTFAFNLLNAFVFLSILPLEALVIKKKNVNNTKVMMSDNMEIWVRRFRIFFKYLQ